MNDGAALSDAAFGGSRIDIAIISYALYHYMSTSHCTHWLARALKDSTISVLLTVERFENTSSIKRS